MTTHLMKLKALPYKKIENGTKIIEIRLNDKKRQQIQVGDIINFSNSETGETIKTEVAELFRCNSLVHFSLVIH